MDAIEWSPNSYNITVFSDEGVSMVKTIKDWFGYWRNFFRGIVSEDRYDVVDEASDSPIYDQLEREWAKKGHLSLTLGTK
jgi:hypothetical protein